MKPTKYILPIFEEQQLLRLEEIKFYIYTIKFKKIAKNLKQYTDGDLVAILADITDTSAVDLQNAMILITQPQCIPNQKETAVLLKYLNIPYREVNDNYMSTRTFYNLLDEYTTDNEYSKLNLLVPRLDNETSTSIQLFNKRFKERVVPVFKILAEKPNETAQREGIEYADARY